MNGTVLCGPTSYCINTVGSYNCTCRGGYLLSWENQCEGMSLSPSYPTPFLLMVIVLLDVDECALGIFQCNENTTCVNTIGSYNCSCKPGFEGVGSDCYGIPSRFCSIYFLYVLFVV